jgi:O-antigen ligase
MQNSSNSPPGISEGRLFATLTAFFYIVFTLIADSSTLVVSWSWVFIWQVALLCPVLWLLWVIWHQKRFPYLGQGLDWGILLIVIALIISTAFAQFHSQAIWYSWAALCLIAAIYAINSWLKNSQRRYNLLYFQCGLNIAFIVVSLFLWFTQTFLPELAKINSFKPYGINLSYDFSVLELRNWAPLGHQNYVAGYLLLSLPLLMGLSIIQQGKLRWLWTTGIVLGIVDLYTTSSRGGWIGLVVACLFGFIIVIFRSNFSRFWLGLGGAGVLLLIGGLILTNNRLRILLIAILNGQGGDPYRIINGAVGWEIGSSNPLSGVGLGGVSLLYQKYRPFWAGRESELTFQLHNTPAQIWAELGILGIVAEIGSIGLFIYLLWRWLSQHKTEMLLATKDEIIVWSITASFLAYGIMSLTDYQLDNLCISGTLGIFVALIANIFRRESQQSLSHSTPKLVLSGIGVVITATIWLIPVHWAWLLSSQAFFALQEKQPNVDVFSERLSKAHQLASWEPYYPYQLGWNLANLGIESNNGQLLREGIRWFEIGNKISPYQEFGHTNLGWLLVNNNPKLASQEFSQASQLVPAKHGVFFGLGLSMLLQKNPDLFIQSVTIEALRDPLFITSPIWKQPLLQSFYPQITDSIMDRYNDFLKKEPDNSYWHICRGGLALWLGDLATAKLELDKYGTLLDKIMLELAEGKDVKSELANLPESSSKKVIGAWLEPQRRLELLKQAWIETDEVLLPEKMQRELLDSMAKSANFLEWLTTNSPSIEYHRQREGFGVISRHIDGIQPTDFWLVVDNLPMTKWFTELFPSPVYAPDLDIKLQPLRDQLWQRIGAPDGH